ncbi:UNVERIFIED_CONTAM: hypothetical protein Sradi_1529700 [Sesamum radiatum]|uniref:Transposase n=1 Tax=Sesamum radiatum TaxID=300843 RepID=A0AAW2UAA0_SESRA
MSSHSCEHMTWHTKCVEDETMTHPAHGEAWRHFDTTHPQFSSEPRNVRLGLCTDGFSPFNISGAPYSCWPVIVTVYNLPPGMCMQRPYMFLCMVIPGPKSPSKNLDIFLRHLIDELKTLWTKGIQTYDACKKENFQMRQPLPLLPANGMVLGWSTHGLMACPYCMEFTKSFSLQNDNDPPLEWEEEMQDDPFNGDPPSRNSVGHSFPPRRRGLSRGTSQPIDPSLRIFIRVIGSSFYPPSVVSEISASVRYHMQGPWPSWGHYPNKLKEYLWEIFKSKYIWTVGRTSDIYNTWWDVADRRLRDMLDYWSKEKFLRLSEAGKKNRTTPNDGPISTHTGGSKPFAAYKEDMQREYNREVSDIELYDRTHRGNKGTGEFSCDKAKKVRVTYDTLVQGKDASNPSSPHNFDPVAWLEASGGLSKGRVYGFGSQPLHRSFGDIACGSGFKAKHKEAAKNAQEESNERFDRLQKEMEKLKQTNMQLQGQQRVILKAMEQCLPDTIRQMLQDIQWTNHSHAGGSGNQEQQYVDSINRGEGRRSRGDSNRYNNENVMSNVGINDAHDSEEGDTED